MRKYILLAFCALQVNSFASGTLECVSEDGSSIRASINNQDGSVPTGVEYSSKGGSFRPATVLQYISKRVFFNGSAQKEEIQTLAFRDTQTGELAAVLTNGSYIDRAGAYSSICSFEY